MGNQNLAAEWENATPITASDWDTATPITKETWNNADPVKVDKGFWREVGSSIKQRAGTAYNEMMSPVTGNVLAQGPQKLLRVAGEAGGLIADVGVAGMKAIIPESFKQAGEYLLSSDIGKAQVETLKGIGTGYEKLRGMAPESMKNIEAGMNIVGGAGVLKGVGPLVKGGVTAAKDVAKVLTKKTAAEIDTAIKNEVAFGIERAIKPAKTGGQTYAKTMGSEGSEGIYDKWTTGIKGIIEDAPTMEGVDLQNMDVAKLSNAIGQRKRNLLAKTEAIKSGAAGVVGDTTPIIKELEDFIAKAQKGSSYTPAQITYAEKKLQFFKENPKMSPIDLDQDIINYNKQLAPFYRNPSYADAGNAAVDARIVRLERNILDDTINNVSGKGDEYRALKHEWGGLTSIENDVEKASRKIAQKTNALDFYDIMSGGFILSGLLTMNPTALITSTGVEVAKRFAKMQKDPNRQIKNMFRKVSKLQEGAK